MNSSTRRKLNKAIQDLPGLPAASAEIMMKLADDDFSIQEIAGIVTQDPGLTAQVIKRSNSAFFGFVRKADTAEEATPRLGRSGLVELVLDEQLGKACAHIGPVGELLWRHSMATALIARKLAESLEYGDASMAYTSGLMHDAGKLVMSQLFQEESGEILRLVRELRWEILESEKHVLGLDHAELGVLVAKKWSLSKRLSEVVALHHNPGGVKKDRALVMIVAVADTLAKNCGASSYSEQYTSEYAPEALSYLELSKANVAYLENEAADLIAESGDLLRLD